MIATSVDPNTEQLGKRMLSRVTVALTGDIIPVRKLSPLSESAKSVFDFVGAADFAVGNFEIPLTRKGNPLEKLLNIRADPTIANSFSVLGLDVVTVANNHSVDYGWEGLSETVSTLRETGLRVVGAGDTIVQAQRPEIAEVAGKKIGIIAFSCLLPTGMAASPDRPGISPIHIHTSYEIDSYYQMEEPGDISVVQVRTQTRSSDLALAVSAVKALKQRCDIAVVTIHWGFGSGEDLAEYQHPLAKSLIDAGADVIHGHHPHAIHAIGFYKNRPIFFSLGTLVGQQVFLEASPAVKALWAGMSPDGYVATLTISNDGDIAVEMIPTTLDSDRLPRIATGTDLDRIRDRLSRLSPPYGAYIESSGAVLRAKAATT